MTDFYGDGELEGLIGYAMGDWVSDLDWITRSGRKVIIAYDSDLVAKVAVRLLLLRGSRCCGDRQHQQTVKPAAECRHKNSPLDG